MFKLFGLILFISIAGCNGIPKLYKIENPKRISLGTLSPDDYASLRNYLQKQSDVPLKDTLIIIYNFKNESCWTALDLKSDEYIKGVVSGRRTWINQLSTERPNVSILQFREPGHQSNKFVKWNDKIKIDNKNFLRSLLFKDRTICGTSALILPNRKFLLLRSDAHYQILLSLNITWDGL